MGIRIWGEQTWIIQNQLTNSIMEGCILFIWIPLRVGNLDSCIMYRKMYLITFCQFPETGGFSRLCFPWEEEQGTAPLARFK